MYVLEDGTSLTNRIKEAFKRGLTRAYIKVGNTIIDQSNYLVNAKYKDEKADPETGTFIGITSMRELDIKLLNIDNTFNLENADIEYHIGALVGEEYKYINLGNFIVQKPTNEEVNEEMTFTALDYMSKFDTDDPYEPQVIFPTTLLGLAQDVCSQAGVTLGNTDFRNADKQILANPFVNGENMRTVLKSIAKLSFSCGYIGQDNKLYFGFDISDEVTESITIDDYIENKPNNEIKPITALTLRSSEIKTVGQTIYDTEHIVEYGTNELLIEEDYIAYTDELRLAYLNGARDLFGLTYKPLSIDVLGSVYLSFNDVIEVTNLQGEKHKTYALNNTHEYNGTLYNTISVPALSEVEERYKYETEDVNSRRRTNVNINKAEQRIELIETEIGDRSEKTSSITQEIDQIASLVQETIDITRTTQGIDPLVMDNCMQGYLLELHIYGNNTVFDGLYPSNALYPSNNLYPRGDARIRVWTDNLCTSAGWENKALVSDGGVADDLQSLVSPFIKVSDLEIYVSLENQDYSIDSVRAYDENKQYLNGTIEQIIKANYEEIVTLPQNTEYVRVMVKKKNLENIDVSEISKIKPMVTIGNTKIDYCGYNDAILDLGVNSVLRQFVNENQEVIRDEYKLVNNRGTLIRRVGVDNQGSMYELVSEITTDLGEIYIPIAEGKNYFNIVNYDANCLARYVIINEYTSTFATTVQLSSAITQLATEINLQVSKKVGQEEYNSQVQLLYDAINLRVSQNNIVSALNLGIRDGQGIIEILGNLIRIATDYFKINLDGTIEATGGKIASFNINNNALESENCGMSNNQYAAFWCKVGNVDTFRVTWNGDISCATILVDGNPLIKTIAGTQEVKTIYADSGQLVFTLNNAIWVVLPDGGGSDEKLKKNINNSKIKALDEISKMRFAEFDWKATGEYQDIGLIAQELEKINPNLVSEITFQDDTQKIINNSKLIFYSLKGVQELQEKVNEQQKEIDELRKMIEELKKGEK